MNYEAYIDSNLSKQQEWFTDTEIRAAAKLYNLPIITFSGNYSTPFFDMINEALTFAGNFQSPLYLHHIN